MRSSTIATLLLATQTLIGASNTLGGTALRASLALPLAESHVITADQYATFALDAHVVDLPAPFGLQSAAQCTTDAECEGVSEAEYADAKDAQCRQDDQDDVVSIQLNIEFDCYSH